ncbi:hypothetical protein Mame01_31470 [Microbispora amethystogenes]|nr:hypothetical protein Mame01_31470 [Microbispora amethystogenes]
MVQAERDEGRRKDGLTSAEKQASLLDRRHFATRAQAKAANFSTAGGSLSCLVR